MKMLMFDFRESEKDFFEKNQISDIQIEFLTQPLNKLTELTQEQLEQTDVINVFTTSHLCEETLSKFKNLRLIITRSTSFSHIDLSYCTKHGIAVYNVENYGQTSVAEYAIALILMLVRKINVASSDMKKHKISYKKYEGANLNSLTIGIIGCGSIGSAVAKIAHFFGMKVLVSSYMKNPELVNSCEFVEQEELLKNADIITLHIPFIGDNYHMISYNEIEKMKDGVFIVNTSRGELIDIEALYNNLKTGKISGAALDVLECEYLSNQIDELVSNANNHNPICVQTALITQKLFNMDNVIITPHIAYNTTQSVNYLLETSFNNVRDYVKGMYTNRVC